MTAINNSMASLDVWYPNFFSSFFFVRCPTIWIPFSQLYLLLSLFIYLSYRTKSMTYGTIFLICLFSETSLRALQWLHLEENLVVHRHEFFFLFADHIYVFCSFIQQRDAATVHGIDRKTGRSHRTGHDGVNARLRNGRRCRGFWRPKE